MIWKTIETIPKDVTVLLGKFHAGAWYWIASGIVYPETSIANEFWCDFTDADMLPEGHHKPTHWAPLPSPPDEA